MSPLLKRKMLRSATLAAGIAAAAAVGALFPDTTPDRNYSTAVGQSQVRSQPASAEAAENEEDVRFIEYRKAGIGEYQMLAAVTAAPSVEVVEVVDDSALAVVKPESFAVVLPEDGTQVYDPQPEPLNFTKTRSVASEYFTVKDIISGKTVTMNAHEMLCRMVYSEIGANWNEEAIKAQVVAAYSHLRFNDAIGVIPSVGLKSGYPEKIERCVKAVEGQCVYYNNGIANTVYCASTAGYTAECSRIWGVSYGYLKPVVSAYDSEDPNFGVNTYFSEDTIRSIMLNKLGFYLSDDIANWFEITSVHSGRYVGNLSIDGGRARMTGEAARKLFGLRSGAFEITYNNGTFCFRTYGYGHGVGMSQWGMKLYADRGFTYDQILRHYYVNTTIGLSPLSEKAAKRGGMSESELAAEIDSSLVAVADGISYEKSDEIVITDTTVPASTKEDKTKDTEKKQDTEKKTAADKKDSTDQTAKKKTDDTKTAQKDKDKAEPEESQAEEPSEEKKTEEPEPDESQIEDEQPDVSQPDMSSEAEDTEEGKQDESSQEEQPSDTSETEEIIDAETAEE